MEKVKQEIAPNERNWFGRLEMQTQWHIAGTLASGNVLRSAHGDFLVGNAERAAIGELRIVNQRRLINDNDAEIFIRLFTAKPNR